MRRGFGTWSARLWPAVMAGVAGACLHVAEFRAEHDLTVGNASTGDVSVAVAQGMAAVRGLSSGELWLWASAPELSIQLSTGSSGGRRWSVRMENQLSDAILTAETSTGEALAVTLAEEPYATERRWEVDLPASAEVTLRLVAPDAGEITPWRFAALADVQEKIDTVQDIYAKINERTDVRFALFSGDLTEQGTPEELTRFQKEMKTLRLPFYSTLGNHELGTRDELYHEYFGRGNRSFVFRGVQFTLIDSASATLDPLVYEWLDGWLAEGRDRLHVVTMHVPPFDPIGERNGAFANRGEAGKLVNLLASGNVDMTIYGHLHSFYAYQNAGIPAYITGGGGSIEERMDGISRHFIVVDVDPPRSVGPVAIVRVD
ncbi:metallophosphoesterase family protein [Chondromyces crocatus]|uniref:Metallophosphoesterase n=1 Tax=Chondromyces crocatus TaxID=52 RepID=A0A0K1ERN9_CHOCO|nr:metallophosphoesterase [Chondromyces crocatus]AKT43322.1 metallophosphoesterase [Chondromyces crocatus]